METESPGTPISFNGLSKEQDKTSFSPERKLRALQSSFEQGGEKNEAFRQSLDYAELIQKALLPKDRHLDRGFEDHFAIHWQKEGVGGDFYWFAQAEGVSYVVVADCTGHGVPGAMLAVLGQSLLNYIVLGKELRDPSSILQELDERLIASFQLSEQEYFHNDWIDLSLIAYEPEKNEVEFAGAQRTILHVKEEECAEYRGSGYPIGGWQLENERNFPSIRFPVEKGEALYLGSDGFQDQFGGKKGKKFGRRRLRDLLLTLRERPMEVQREELTRTFFTWKEGHEQIDDVCILGLRI